MQNWSPILKQIWAESEGWNTYLKKYSVFIKPDYVNDKNHPYGQQKKDQDLPVESKFTVFVIFDKFVHSFWQVVFWQGLFWHCTVVGAIKDKWYINYMPTSVHWSYGNTGLLVKIFQIIVGLTALTVAWIRITTWNVENSYRKIASSNTSRLEVHVEFFRLLMKGTFGPYVLWPFDKKLFF